MACQKSIQLAQWKGQTFIFSCGIAGPPCTKTLAYQGALVVKFKSRMTRSQLERWEQNGFENYSAMFPILIRKKCRSFLKNQGASASLKGKFSGQTLLMIRQKLNGILTLRIGSAARPKRDICGNYEV